MDQGWNSFLTCVPVCYHFFKSLLELFAEVSPSCTIEKMEVFSMKSPINKSFYRLKAKEVEVLNPDDFQHLLEFILTYGNSGQLFNIDYQENILLWANSVIFCYFLVCIIKFCITLCQKLWKYQGKHILHPSHHQKIGICHE